MAFLLVIIVCVKLRQNDSTEMKIATYSIVTFNTVLPLIFAVPLLSHAKYAKLLTPKITSMP